MKPESHPYILVLGTNVLRSRTSDTPRLATQSIAMSLRLHASLDRKTPTPVKGRSGGTKEWNMIIPYNPGHIIGEARDLLSPKAFSCSLGLPSQHGLRNL